MTSSNLVPTPIVNKNGVQTTVYKAAGDPNSSPAGNLPAPALGGAGSINTSLSAEVLLGLRASFEDPWVTIPSVIGKNAVRRTLEGYPEDTQRYIRETQLMHPDDHFFDRMLISMIYNRDSPETIEDVLYAYTNIPDSWEAFTCETGWTDDRFDVDYDLIQTVNGAKSYGFEVCTYGTEDKSLRHYDEQTRTQALALIALYSEMSMHDELRGGLGGDDTSYYITDKSTVQHIAQNPEMVDDMLQEMLVHGRADWGLIESLKNAPSVPLREGTL